MYHKNKMYAQARYCRCLNCELFASGTVTCDYCCLQHILHRVHDNSSHRADTPQRADEKALDESSSPHYYFSIHSGIGHGRRSGQDQIVTHSQNYTRVRRSTRFTKHEFAHALIRMLRDPSPQHSKLLNY